MFCDTCHWYTAGEKICPHCGAAQKPPEPDALFGIRKPEPAPKPVAPLPAPASKPAPVPRPAPPPPAPQPVPPPSGVNKQGFKALVLVLVGVVVLILVLFVVEMAGENANYIYQPDDNDSYYYDDEITEPVLPLWEARAGDIVYFGNTHWRVLDEDPPEHLLLLLEYEIYLEPEEIGSYLNEFEAFSDVVFLGTVEFTIEEFARIAPTAEGKLMFVLSPEQLERYGLEPPEIWDEEAIAVRPAIWVNVWEDGL